MPRGVYNRNSRIHNVGADPLSLDEIFNTLAKRKEGLDTQIDEMRDTLSTLVSERDKIAHILGILRDKAA